MFFLESRLLVDPARLVFFASANFPEPRKWLSKSLIGDHVIGAMKLLRVCFGVRRFLNSWTPKLPKWLQAKLCLTPRVPGLKAL